MVLKPIFENILTDCCNAFEVLPDDVLSDCRKQELVYTRMAFVIIIKEKFDLSNQKIGDFLNRKHNDIHYLYKKQETNKYFNLVLNALREKCKEY